ncbi:MAG: putative glutamate--cysteine ligase, partial [Synechococcaceae cyanobacterium]
SSARSSLEAGLHHWRDGRPIHCRQWIEEGLEELRSLARQEQLDGLLAPLERVLREGNQAMRWLAQHRAGASIAAILSAEAEAMAAQEGLLEDGADQGVTASATDHTDRQAGVLG